MDSPRSPRPEEAPIPPPADVSPPPSQRDCDSSECRARVKKLELVIQRNAVEIKRLRANNKEYMLQSSSQMLVQAIQTQRRLNGNCSSSIRDTWRPKSNIISVQA